MDLIDGIVRYRASDTSWASALALLITSLGGCAEGVWNDDGAGYATIAPVPDGQRWCVRLPNPLACTDPRIGDDPDPWQCTSPAVETEINEPPPDGADPEGCGCAPPELDGELSDLNGDVQDTEPEMLTNFRDDVFERAESRCETIVASMNPLPDFSNCDFALAQYLDANSGVYPSLYKEGQPGDCAAAGHFGEVDDTTAAGMEPLPPDDYTDYYTLSSEISVDTMAQEYVIDETFFYDVLDNPGWLFSDGVRFEPAMGGGYELTGVTSGTIAHALGLQNGDRPRVINGHDITTVDEVLAAYDALRQATSFDLTIDRNSNPLTISYRVD